MLGRRGNTGIFMRYLSCASHLKHFRSLDVLEIDAAEGRYSAATVSTTRSMVSAADFDAKTFDGPANFLNRHACPAITGLEGQRAEIAQAPTLGNVWRPPRPDWPGRSRRPLRRGCCDFGAGRGDPGRIGSARSRWLAAVVAWDLEFTGPRQPVMIRRPQSGDIQNKTTWSHQGLFRPELRADEPVFIRIR